MAQSASGKNGNKNNEYDSIVERCYQTHFADGKEVTSADFYRAVCETVEEINKKLGSTQFNVPKTTTLKLVFEKHLNAIKKVTEEVAAAISTEKVTDEVAAATSTEKVTDEVATDKSTEKATDAIPITKEKFEEIVQEVIVESGFSAGFGAKDILTYIFGIPTAALLIKQRFGPKTIPNDLFIPAITSATVFLLAKLQKI